MDLNVARENYKNVQAQQEDNHITSLSVEITSATEMYLDHLNDDCLYDIFSRSSLTPMDLCSLAETCKFFKRIAQLVFPKKLDIAIYDSKYWIKWKDYERDVNTYRNIERMLKHFGSCIVELSVDDFESDHTMKLVAKYCVGTLKELTIRSVKIPEVLAVELKPIFQQLQSLSIDKVPYTYPNMFSNCDSLIALKITNPPINIDEIVENNFPKLQRFALEYTDADWGYIDFSFEHLLLNFFERHKTLKCINFDSHRFKAFLRKRDITNELEELLITSGNRHGSRIDLSYFQSLKQLSLHRGPRRGCINVPDPTIVGLQKLKSLEILKITGLFDSREVVQALPLLNNLRELDVNRITRKIAWGSLTQLTKLRLSNLNPRVVDIIRELGNLEELEVGEGPFALSEKEFYKIVNVVQGRPNVLTLKCPFEFSQSSESYLRICNGNSTVKLIKMK